MDPAGDRVVGSLCPHPFDAGLPALWTRSGEAWSLTLLPDGGYAHAYPVDVSPEGIVIGYVGTNPGWRAVAWTRGGGWSMTLLEPLPGGPASGGRRGEPVSRPIAINAAGHIVGTSNDAAGTGRAVVWRRSRSGWGRPEVVGDPAWRDAWASGIDAFDRIAGSAVLASGPQVGFLHDPASGVTAKLEAGAGTASAAHAIANRGGRIVGSGFDYRRAVMWIVD